MLLNRNAYLVGALLLIVGVLPHRVRQYAQFGLFFRLYATLQLTNEEPL